MLSCGEQIGSIMVSHCFTMLLASDSVRIIRHWLFLFILEQGFQMRQVRFPESPGNPQILFGAEGIFGQQDEASDILQRTG